MPSYHPDIDFLTAHAAGSLPLAQGACVAAHLNYCHECRRTVSALQDVGAALFEQVAPQPVSEQVLDRVLARLDEAPPLHFANHHPAGEKTPAILQRLMSGDFADLVWKKVTRTLSISYLKTGDPGHEFALYHIRAGGRIPLHGHRGDEITLVLQGGFSDADGDYHAGDFLFRRAGEEHAPTALQSEDCICLGVLDAPLRFRGWAYRWMNPFLRLQPG
ncbi:ChrR family anti-sigma-E factor [Parahaliea mediterranea]|uniref:ChrR family anti-sigma-E factor n=1 Tax=Parahaliea mediterranea TaxID=651086 RepID=UPI000E2FC2C2|nr:ChrR family anti-sigma-E factor [Parahaliea mediterranea]